MLVYKRFAVLISIIILTTSALLFRSRETIRSSRVWRKIPQKIGLGEWVLDDEDEYKPEFQALQQSSFTVAIPHEHSESQKSPAPEVAPSKFQPGTLKALGTPYTKGVVIGRIQSENVTWLEEAAFPDEVQTYIYGIDDATSLLRTPQNKGREAMVYLSYIIDHYDKLPDISIFLHPHQRAWHNSELLNHDSTEMIRRLSSERVTREGYMNLRCSWVPGCPQWIDPGAIIPDRQRPEEGLMAEAWATLFPGDPIPKNIASACCAQFAVSRDRIRSIPLQKFEHYRNWLLQTPLPDQLSGRILEYLWGKIFTDEAVTCPDQRACYCDGYGVCFEHEKVFDYWFELRHKQLEVFHKLQKWQQQADWLDRARNDWGSLELKDVVIPPVDEDTRLQAEIDSFQQEMETMRLEALQLGIDPKVRAKIAGRPWRDGDGY